MGQEWVKLLREELGYSQSELAEELGISRQRLHQIENSVEDGLSLRFLIRFWRLSKVSGKKFLELIAKEIGE